MYFKTKENPILNGHMSSVCSPSTSSSTFLWVLIWFEDRQTQTSSALCSPGSPDGNVNCAWKGTTWSWSSSCRWNTRAPCSESPSVLRRCDVAVHSTIAIAACRSCRPTELRNYHRCGLKKDSNGIQLKNSLILLETWEVIKRFGLI